MIANLRLSRQAEYTLDMRWNWIDCIIDFVDERSITAVKTVSLSEDHIQQHFPPETGADGALLNAQAIMPACFILEGMAQTAGILAGSVNRFREKVVLAKIGRATIDLDAFPGDTLRYHATLERMDPAGAATQGTIEVRRAVGEEWLPAGTIQMMFSHLDQNLAGIDFPEENFVFSENFHTILQAAGLDRLFDD